MLWFKIVLTLYFAWCLLYSIYSAKKEKKDPKGHPGSQIAVAILMALMISGIWVFLR